MEWILDHFRIIFFIGVIIAYWINQNRKGWSSSEDREAGGPQGQPMSRRPESDVDADARIREIQAEIRRKIAERRAAAAGIPATPPPLVVRAETRVDTWNPAPPPADEPPSLYSEDQDAESMAWQRRLADQLAEAERAKAAAKVKLEEVWDRPSVAAAKRVAAHLRPHTLSVREILHDRKALRRAWIVREVLEKPVALR